MLAWLDGKKTYLSALSLMITALVGYLNGDVSLSDAILIFLNGTGLASLKHAVTKV